MALAVPGCAASKRRADDPTAAGEVLVSDSLAGSDPDPPSIVRPRQRLRTMKDRGYYFPPPGEGLDVQSRKQPDAVGLRPDIVGKLRGRAPAWALWRHGYLVHVEGNFNHTQHVASLRKTWHALAVGAALGQGRIVSLHDKINAWETDLAGRDAEATWWHVMTQTSAFDYPYGKQPDYRPGEIWTYSDANALRLTNALAKVYGKKGYQDDYASVLRQAYFDAVGLAGWKTSPRYDGAVLSLDLEDMGRLGLLVLARGEWNGVQVIPSWFVGQLEAKQTRGILANYDGPNDGKSRLLENKDRFPEAPYGFFTWTNEDGNYYPGAHRRWSWGSGRGGHVVMWNYEHGIVYTSHGLDRDAAPPVADGVPHVLDAGVVGPNPLVDNKPITGPVAAKPSLRRH